MKLLRSVGEMSCYKNRARWDQQ